VNNWNPDHYRFARQLHRPEAIEGPRERSIDRVIAWLACIGLVALLIWDRLA
jgi:hypothetical protein